MIVHVAPCGLSILDNLKRGSRRPEIRGEPDLTALAAWASREQIHQRPPGEWVQHVRDELGRWLADALARWDPSFLSAECASLAREPRPPSWVPSNDLPPPTDPVVLLASDTAQGILAAALNAAFLGRPVHLHQEPARDLAKPGTPILDGTGTPVHVIRIPGLEPVRTNTFVEAMIEVGAALKWCGRGGWLDADAMILHVSGGYKATIPYFMVFGEYLKALGGSGANVRVFCLHGGDGGQRRPEPVEIWLRTPNTDADKAELDAVGAQNAEAIKKPHLAGFAYEELGGQYRLTPLGRVLSTFLATI